MKKILLLLLLALASCAAPAASQRGFNDAVEGKPPVVEESAVPPVQSRTVLENGTYQVGVDVDPGRYKTAGPPKDSILEMCTWSRNKNDSGEFNAIIANGLTQGPGSITIKDKEFVELSGDCVWKKA